MTIVVGGFGIGLAFSMATAACQDNLYAHWLATHGPGPPARLYLACAPSYLAHEYALEFVYLSAAFAVAAAVVALGMFVAGRLIRTSRVARVRRIVGWVNLGALSLMMVAIAAVAGCGEGEVQYFSIPAVGVGFVVSLLGSFSGPPVTTTSAIGKA
jgi:hypothetical protein